MLKGWGRCLGTLVIGCGLLSAEQHVVSPGELAGQVRAAAASRQQNIAKIEGFLVTDAAQQALRSLRADPVKVRTGVAALSDQELARLASRTAQVESGFAAGELSHFQITLIIVGAIVLGIIIAIAAA